MLMLARLFPGFCCAALLVVSAAGEELFDGKSLEGWSGDPRLWRVDDGAIVGETDAEGRKIDRNTFLIWQGEVADFELSFKARVTGNNSGVQYRSEVTDPAKWVVKGYQCDLHPKAEYLGMLYEEGGRGIACLRGQKVELAAGKKPVVTGKVAVPEVDLAQWNDYRVVAKGHTLQHYVNGELAAEIVDKDPGKRSERGVLALQLHRGPAMKAEFKEIRLKKLDESAKPEKKKR